MEIDADAVGDGGLYPDEVGSVQVIDVLNRAVRSAIGESDPRRVAREAAELNTAAEVAARNAVDGMYHYTHDAGDWVTQAERLIAENGGPTTTAQRAIMRMKDDPGLSQPGSSDLLNQAVAEMGLPTPSWVTKGTATPWEMDIWGEKREAPKA